jgi:hypothetical protein
VGIEPTRGLAKQMALAWLTSSDTYSIQFNLFILHFLEYVTAHCNDIQLSSLVLPAKVLPSTEF